MINEFDDRVGKYHKFKKDENNNSTIYCLQGTGINSVMFSLKLKKKNKNTKSRYLELYMDYDIYEYILSAIVSAVKGIKSTIEFNNDIFMINDEKVESIIKLINKKSITDSEIAIYTKIDIIPININDIELDIKVYYGFPIKENGKLIDYDRKALSTQPEKIILNIDDFVTLMAF
jgi:hypothetical protein